MARKVGGLKEYLEYKAELDSKVVVIQHLSDIDRIKVVKPAYRSRYFPEGREYISRKMRRRIGKYENVDGVMLTLTFDPSLISKGDAWCDYGAYVSNVLNVINQYRYRRRNRYGGRWPRLSYFWVVEVQKKTGYPHVHIFFPRLKWLAPGEYLRSVCNLGRSNVKRMGAVNGAAYICKYLRKMEAWSELSQAFLWKGGCRLYSFSRGYFKKLPEKVKEWGLKAICGLYEAWVLVMDLWIEGRKIEDGELVGFKHG